jgi:ankyrin repeat protein
MTYSAQPTRIVHNTTTPPPPAPPPPPQFRALEGSVREVKVMGILLDAGADIEAPNSDGHTPLSVACDLNELEVVSLLLRRGANPNAELPDELTPFKICCFGQTALPIFTKVLGHGGKLPTRVALRLIGGGSDETSRAKRQQLINAFVTEGHWPTGLRQFRS